MAVKTAFDILLTMVIMLGAHKGVSTGTCCARIKGGYTYHGKELYIRKKNSTYEYGSLSLVSAATVVSDALPTCVIGHRGNRFGL